ncbi:hypothetical protein RJ641_023085 [Dillenia turbinata]|uniref:Zinc-finger domain-containing protein n=1 Tax=Dillenia turbinata TaxID=194707 RepID=A0AAN8YSB1_9MAGN
MATPLSTSKIEIIEETRFQVNLPLGKRNKCPGACGVGSQTYNSHNGKTCHQVNKLCTIKFCRECLLNRKKRGLQPTGALVKTAKAAGFSSVNEMLRVEGFENVDSLKANGASQKKLDGKDGASLPIKRGKENLVGNGDQSFRPRNAVGDRNQKRVKREGLRENNRKNICYCENDDGEDLENKCLGDMAMLNNSAGAKKDDGEVQLPQGNESTREAGVDVPTEDVRHALDFLQLCSSVWED